VTDADAKAAERPVLWLHSHFLLPAGGTKMIYEVTRRLAQRRPVEVLVERASPLWRERYAEVGVPLHEIGGDTSTSMAYWAAFPAFLRRDRSAVTRAAVNASAIVSSFFPMPWVASRVAREGGLRHVSLCFEPFPFFHDDEVIRMYSTPKQALLRFLAAAYGRVDLDGIQGADALLTLNETTKGQIERTYGRRDARCTYAGVDTEFFRPYTPDETRVLADRIGPGPIVVHSTDFSPIKRTDLAIEAFAVAAQQVPTARLVVTSTREDPPELTRLMARAAALGVAGQVEYLGFLPFADLPKLYSLAEVLLQTGTSLVSGATTMSLPVKEALACGTPVVRSGVTGEDVEDGVSGYLVDPTDPVETGGRLATILRDPTVARAMGEAGREKITRRYTWDRVVDVIEEALDGR
jgi:glycosyltransferase involved in cell wall biosynthesis